MLDCQKHLFSLRDGEHYLNCAYKGPLLQSAEAAAIHALEKMKNPGDTRPEDFFSEVEEVRRLVGRLLHCQAAEVAIIPSVSYGLGSVLNNIPCKSGQHAVTVENEFPSDYFALARWCKENKAGMKIIRPADGKVPVGRTWNEKLLEAITTKTALVVLSSVHWMTGMKFELKKIGSKCQSVGAKLIVDGTQSVGALPIDVKGMKIDALICAGYKWLLGPYSLGFAYISNYFNEGIPLEESWMNRTNAHDFSNLTTYDPVYKPAAGRYNMGEASHFILMPMLQAALEQNLAWSPLAIQSYARKRSKTLMAYLANNGIKVESNDHFSSHMFGLQLPVSYDKALLNKRLKANNVYLSRRGNSLRVSIHVFNTEEDIQSLVTSLEESRMHP